MRNADARSLGTLPSAAGHIARLAYVRAKKAGVPVLPLLKKAGITLRQIEDRDERLKVSSQIRFLNLVADALSDEYLGFHLGQLPDLGRWGLMMAAGIFIAWTGFAWFQKTRKGFADVL